MVAARFFRADSEQAEGRRVLLGEGDALLMYGGTLIVAVHELMLTRLELVGNGQPRCEVALGASERLLAPAVLPANL